MPDARPSTTIGSACRTVAGGPSTSGTTRVPVSSTRTVRVVPSTSTPTVAGTSARLPPSSDSSATTSQWLRKLSPRGPETISGVLQFTSAAIGPRSSLPHGVSA